MPTGVDPPVEQLATAATTVDGHAARRGSGTAEGSQPTSVLLLPDPGVVIAITGPTEADPDAIFGTVRVAPRDGLGCQDHVASFTPPNRAASALLVPGQPKSGVICEYLSLRSENTPVDWLIGSTELTSAQLSELPGLVNALPPAASSPSAAPTPLGPFIWFELHDADGTTRTLAATLDTSPTLVTDGRHTVTTNNPQLLPDAFDH